MIATDAALGAPLWATLGVWGVGEQILRIRDHFSKAFAHGSQDAGTILWAVGGLVGGFAVGVWCAAIGAVPMPAPTVWLVVGLTIAWAGIVLRWWAVHTLGPFFTTRVVVQADQRVITAGPYRVVRHPSYLGILLVLAGLGVALADLASVAAMILLPTAGLLPRIKVEEAALRAGMGERYLAYAKGRARLIPGIW